MNGAAALALILSLALAGAGQAGEPEGLAAAPAMPQAGRDAAGGPLTSPRPPRRPEAAPAARAAPERPANPASAVRVVEMANRGAVLRSPRPAARPERSVPVPVAAAAVPVQPDPRGIVGRRGMLCGDARLKGERVAPIAGRIAGCGIEAPVKVTEAAGLRLTTAATVDCATAVALADWIEGSVRPSVGRLGGGVAGLQVAASYACRGRNNQPGAKVSEHGRGRAIDIGAIVLRNGATIRVLDHWRDDSLGPLLKAMHRGACGPFGTVLGPEADRFHHNHLHLDTTRHRAGAFCR